MKAIRKCPGQGPEIVDVPSMAAVMKKMGADMRGTKLTEGVILVWDGTWKENGKRPNESILGVLTGGPALILGLKDYQLIDVPNIDFILHRLFGAVRYRRADRAHNVWNCRHCGHMEHFEADGPFENGWNLCPVCGGWIVRGAPPAAESSDLSNGWRSADAKELRRRGQMPGTATKTEG